MMKKHDVKIDFDVLAEMDKPTSPSRKPCAYSAPDHAPPHVPQALQGDDDEEKDYVVPKGHIVATSPRSRRTA